MKKILLVGLFLMTTSITVLSAKSNLKYYAEGCATGVQNMNLMGNKEKVSSECKKCLERVPMYNVDKTSSLIDSLVPVCVDEYFESRKK